MLSEKEPVDLEEELRAQQGNLLSGSDYRRSFLRFLDNLLVASAVAVAGFVVYLGKSVYEGHRNVIAHDVAQSTPPDPLRIQVLRQAGQADQVFVNGTLLNPPVNNTPPQLQIISDVPQFNHYLNTSKHLSGLNPITLQSPPQDMFERYRNHFNADFFSRYYTSTPPSVFRVSGLSDARTICSWRFAAVCYLTGTTAIVLSLGERPQSIFHEITHFIRARSNPSETVRFCDGSIRSIPTFFDEGGTEYTAQIMVNGYLQNPTYPRETDAFRKITTIAGGNTALDSYFTGDMCPIERAFDTRYSTVRSGGSTIGNGTFRTLFQLMDIVDSGNTRAGEYHAIQTTFPGRYLDDLESKYGAFQHSRRPPAIRRVTPTVLPRRISNY